MKHQAWKIGTAVAAAGLLGTAGKAHAQAFTPGDILVSLSVYPQQPVGQAAGLVAGVSQLPDSAGPNKSGVTTPYTANADGAYEQVFNNASVDGSFGVTSPILLDEIDPTTGNVADSINVTQEAAFQGLDVVTSFSSKSEIALNLSTNNSAVTFMAYDSTPGTLDVSNSNTPGVIEPGNYVTTTATAREVVQLNADGTLGVTTTNAYSGNNGRAAILDNADNEYLTVGNAGNGNGSAQVTGASGVQQVTPGSVATSTTPGTTLTGSFNITQTNPATGQPYATSTTPNESKDKAPKDNNYRGETDFDNTLYVTKGSGSNGINTVYQVGNSGSLPSGTGNAINILPGLPTGLARNIVVGSSNTTSGGEFYPFGIFFANSTTLYVADEGDGSNTATDNPTSDPNAGLEKWSLNTSTGDWNLDYTLQAGLGLGQAESVGGTPNLPDAYPDPETDGLRNITGLVNPNGSVTIYGVTSTVSTSGDEGADPNEIVDITDDLADTTLPTNEQFSTLEGAQYRTVYRGVSFTPQATAVPEASSLWLLGLGLAPLGLLARRRRA